MFSFYVFYSLVVGVSPLCIEGHRRDCRANHSAAAGADRPLTRRRLRDEPLLLVLLLLSPLLACALSFLFGKLLFRPLLLLSLRCPSARPELEVSELSAASACCWERHCKIASIMR